MGGEKNRQIAAALRVSERSVERWGSAARSGANSDWPATPPAATRAAKTPKHSPTVPSTPRGWTPTAPIGNLAAANLDQLARAVKRTLKQIQYRPHLVDGCLTGTGLTMDD
ncbi:hypothetical protein ACIPYQ_24920 [Streptomyces sp. NPDC090045]|uniref:hypothetical protein n=1 Tax=Streptomyces sp. NPDC090045 TaxID=3365927 RepID=UPI00382D1904